jgi:hypothetical protein
MCNVSHLDILPYRYFGYNIGEKFIVKASLETGMKHIIQHMGY